MTHQLKSRIEEVRDELTKVVGIYNKLGEQREKVLAQVHELKGALNELVKLDGDGHQHTESESTEGS